MLTLGNLFSGFLAIAKLTDSLHVTTSAQRIDLYTQAIWYVFLAMIFDAIDGKVARMFGAASDFGSQIDSLSDVISFGAAPALLFKVMVEADPGVLSPKAALLLAVVYLACAALRLARFNVETTPDEAVAPALQGPAEPRGRRLRALARVHQHPPRSGERALVGPRTRCRSSCRCIGFLMVSRFPYIHITHALFQDRRPFRFLVLLIFGAALAIWVPEFALPIVVILYVLSGPSTWVRHRVQRRTTAGPGRRQTTMTRTSSDRRRADRRSGATSATASPGCGSRAGASPCCRHDVDSAASAVFETEPVGGPPQGRYLNACIAVETRARRPLALLDAICSRSRRRPGASDRRPTRRARSTSTSCSSASARSRTDRLVGAAPALRASARSRSFPRPRSPGTWRVPPGGETVAALAARVPAAGVRRFCGEEGWS